MKLGPGIMPCMKIAPMNTAAAGEPGMPRLSTGMSEPPTSALLADSGATTPSGTPCPNFSGVGEESLAVE